MTDAVQDATGEHVKLIFPDQGYTGKLEVEAAADHGVGMCVVKLNEMKHGFVLVPRR